ncbi:glycerol kinase [Trifolium repens]|nr:glycerol kinase [Trifolium repens]
MSSEDDVFIGAIDQGTSSTRFIIYDKSAKPIGSHQVEFTQLYPQAGWVEHDPMEILESVKVCIANAVDKATADGFNVDKGLKAIGLTNQRETTLVWSKSTGAPLHHALVWMDVRTSSVCRRLEKELSGGRSHFVESCGLPISTYFSALKLLWLMENVDAVKEAIKKKDALFGTVDTWLIWNLTGGVKGGLHVTDVSNASRTMLMNLKTLNWDESTLKALAIPPEILSKIISNSEVIGNVAAGWPIPGIPISGCLGDQHAAMLGQACRKGEAKSTYGTGAFILLNTGEAAVESKHGLLSTIAYKLGPDAPTNYALEGSVAIAGAAVYTSKGHIARAVLESICFQVKDVIDSMHKDSGAEQSMKDEFLLRVDGGATINNLLMQTQADLLATPVVRPADIETTALGAAYAAGLAVGVWKEDYIFDSKDRLQNAKVFHPLMAEDSRKKKADSWSKAVSRSFDLADL